jgi:hypothetical protein
MRLEHVDRRVLGALRFLDAATGRRIGAPLRIAAPGVRLALNRMGDYVIFEAPGFEAYTAAFLDPPAVASARIEMTVEDPEGEYLPQRVAIDLPRNLDRKTPEDRDRADASDSVFRAIETPLYPAPAARVAPSWALVRATVLRQGTTETLAGALIRVLDRNNNAVMARGLSDGRGEALVAVPGIQVTNWNQAPGPGPVTTHQVAVTIETIFDPAARGFPNPRDLEDRRAQLRTSSQNAQLASGQTLVTTLFVELP